MVEWVDVSNGEEVVTKRPERAFILLATIVLVVSAGCGPATPTPAPTPLAQVEPTATPTWIPVEADAYKDTALPIEERVADLLARMTLAEKIGQMTLVEKNSIVAKEITTRAIGGLLSGGGGYPEPNTPEAWAKMVDGLLKSQVPWVFEVAKKMARIRIADAKVRKLGGGVYEVKAWVENTGGLPYPTAMAGRNQRVLPVIVTLGGQGFDVAQGKKRSLVQSVPARGSQSVTWIVRAAKPVKLEIKAETQIAWGDSRTVDLGGAK